MSLKFYVNVITRGGVALGNIFVQVNLWVLGGLDITVYDQYNWRCLSFVLSATCSQTLQPIPSEIMGLVPYY